MLPYPVMCKLALGQSSPLAADGEGRRGRGREGGDQPAPELFPAKRGYFPCANAPLT